MSSRMLWGPRPRYSISSYLQPEAWYKKLVSRCGPSSGVWVFLGLVVRIPACQTDSACSQVAGVRFPEGELPFCSLRRVQVANDPRARCSRFLFGLKGTWLASTRSIVIRALIKTVMSGGLLTTHRISQRHLALTKLVDYAKASQ